MTRDRLRTLEARVQVRCETTPLKQSAWLAASLSLRDSQRQSLTRSVVRFDGGKVAVVDDSKDAEETLEDVLDAAKDESRKR